MTEILFTNARVFDATGAQPFDGEVLVKGQRIAQVRHGRHNIARGAATQVIDAAGAFLMPGMTEAHTHFGWNDQPTLAAIQMMPPEEHTLWCIRVAKRYLDMGWTSCVGAATAKPRLDVVTRNAIDSGDFPGPRYLAASQEIAHLGGLGDMSLPHLPFQELSFAHVVSGPEEMRKAVRMFVKFGVDQIKLNLSGEYITGLPAELTPFSDEEVAMATAEARRLGKRVAAHARSAESVKQCVRHGIEVIYHASFADEEALDMLEANKDRHFVAPGLAWLVNTCFHAKDYGITTEVATQMGYMRELEAAADTLQKMHKRGIRVLPGGDYGFAWVPHGTNAKDLEYLVKYVGMTPMESLLAATARGGDIMMKPHELGQIREGFLADLLLVDGDPLQNLSLLQEADRLLAIMKDGRFHKAPRAA
ncbi:amidohydrolase family protein [Ideonella sp. DXS22W]|uniref:Amidohydrolase family protein n=1 Tax=Pseudaquabacterium inlustre TaxID=2984192 RepID=A0ABU9CR51_9BURK